VRSGNALKAGDMIMVEVDIFRDYLSLIDSDPADTELLDALEEIEVLLGNPDNSRNRVMYLDSLRRLLEDGGGEPPHREIHVISNPLSSEEIADCIKLGIVQAFSQGLVEPRKLLGLAHSVEGIEELTFSLLEIPSHLQAACWTRHVGIAMQVHRINILDNWEKANLEVSDTSRKAVIQYIIYVDDVAAEAEAITEMIKSRFSGNYRIRGFTSPTEALEFVIKKKDAGQNFAAVVTDMYMPREFHGDELARKIHLVDPVIPVLGYSGHNHYQDPESAKGAGLIDLLSKQGTDTESFLKKVDSILFKSA
jgi:CheY-like chemotaxis protein